MFDKGQKQSSTLPCDSSYFVLPLSINSIFEPCYIYEPPRGKPTMWFLNGSDTNQAVQSQKQARSLKFRI